MMRLANRNGAVNGHTTHHEQDKRYAMAKKKTRKETKGKKAVKVRARTPKNAKAVKIRKGQPELVRIG